MKKLTTVIPERIIVIDDINWMKCDFLIYNESFRDARKRVGIPQDNCGVCQAPFVEGEMLALINTNSRGNLLLCKKCMKEVV